MTHVRDAGTWKEVTAANGMWVRDAGIWKPLTDAWVRDGGTWKKFFTGETQFIGSINPDGNIQTSDWSTPLWEKISDSQQSEPDDATTQTTSSSIQNADNPESFDFEVTMSNPATTPVGSETVKVRVRIYVDMSLGSLIEDDLKIQLKQGTTVKATRNTSVNTGSYSTKALTLSQAEKDSITDWNDLRVLIEINCQVTDEGDEGVGKCTWVDINFS